MDLMKIRAILTLDSSGYESQLKKAIGSAGKFGNVVKNGIGVATKAIAAGVAAAGAAAVAIGKQALASYAEYEQLVGGVETLFGAGGQSFREYVNSSSDSIDVATRKFYELQDAQETVFKNASNAYKTAGMSANEYMTTVTSFSASLIQSLGGDTKTAAELSDMAITDMSDNANKMGTSMESIQNAYAGFAKQNYTMLDNLKLGYGGTKSEMERLIADANKLRVEQGLTGDLTIESYADVITAIHTVQTEMGITGTTAKEASSTIQGSLNMTKAAWANLITGMADDNADFDTLIDNFIDSALSTVGNLLPRIQKIMDGIGKLLTVGAKKIIPVVVKTITDNLPMLITTGIQLILTLVTGLITAIPQLLDAIPEIWEAVKGAFEENWPAIKEAGSEILYRIGEGLLSAWEWLKEKVTEILNKIIMTVIEKYTELVTKQQQKLQAIKDAVVNKWNEIKSNAIATWENIKTEVGDKVQALKDAIAEKIEAARAKVEEIVNKIKSKFNELKNKVTEVANKVKSAFQFNFTMPHIKLPHFTIDPPGWQIGDLLKGVIPKLTVTWYKKAYDNPYMFTKPTLMGFGDGIGGEIVYGHDNLLDDIREASGSNNAEIEAKLDRVIDLMESIIDNGLNANIDKSQMYKTINSMNQKRSRATGYNNLAMA